VLAAEMLEVCGTEFFKDPLRSAAAIKKALAAETARRDAAGLSAELALADSSAVVSGRCAAMLDISVLKTVSRPAVLLPLLRAAPGCTTSQDATGIADSAARLHFDALVADLRDGLGGVGGSTAVAIEDEHWTWGLLHSASMRLSNDNRTVAKVQSSPDYSCAMSGEPFSEGMHEWELLVGAQVTSMWVGIVDEGVRTRLSSSPSFEYGVTLHNSSGFQITCGDCVVEKQEALGYGPGSRILMQLDMNLGAFNMHVNDTHVLAISGLGNRPVHAFVCFDYTESVEITRATKACTVQECSTVSSAVALLFNSLMSLQSGIHGGNFDGLFVNCGEPIVSRFCAMLEAMIASATLDEPRKLAMVQSVDTGPFRSVFMGVLTMVNQMCRAQSSGSVAAATLPHFTRLIQVVLDLISTNDLGAGHWTNDFLVEIVKSVGEVLAVCIWRKPISAGSHPKSDQSVEEWLESDLFSRGFSSEVSHKDLLVSAGQPSCFDRLVLPRVAVHSSHHLDRVEREVIIACLYHSGTLDSMLASDPDISENCVLVCQVRVE
jgi:hypothetical protein